MIVLVAYQERLERLGYKPECARRIVADYTRFHKLDELIEYIDYKEREKRSISDHVTEVLG